MEDMENRILEILNDPQKMEQVMDVAKGLGLSPPEQTSGDGGGSPIPPVPADSRQQALLQALEPYLRPERRRKLERALQMAKLSRLAQTALQGYSDPK